MDCPRCKRTIDAKTRRCGWCGVDVLPGQHLLEESGVVVPIRPATSEDEDAPARLASLGDRFLALILDSVVVSAGSALIGLWAFLKWGIISGGEMRFTLASILVGGSLSLVFGFLYVWILEAGLGSTLGKAILGIGVVNNSGRSALAASAIRNLLRVVDGLAFYLVGALVASCSKFRRRIGDVCAGTYVIEGNLSQFMRAVAVLAWLAVLGGGAWALPRLYEQPKPTEPPKHFARIVVELGRGDKSIHVKTLNHRIEVSMADGTVEANARPISEADSKTKIDDQDAMRALP
ncbi:MAG TPA: RDD family protein [Terriglobales bacterium]|nr:RDD family protein [Terriglobales bacterium]